MQSELIPVTAADVEAAAVWLAEAHRVLDAAEADLVEAQTARKEARKEFDVRLGDWVTLRQRLTAQTAPNGARREEVPA